MSNNSKHDKLAMCGRPDSSANSACGIVCPAGYYITTNPIDGAVTCRNCTACPAGQTPSVASSCNGRKTSNVVCVTPPMVSGYPQTSCPNFEGVYSSMVETTGFATGEYAKTLDGAGSTVSMATHVIFEKEGWCMFAQPIGDTSDASRVQLIGKIVSNKVTKILQCQDAVAEMGTNARLADMSGMTRSSGGTSLRPDNENFIFGDMTSLVYDISSDHLFFVATTYEYGVLGANTVSSITNRHDEVMVMKVFSCTCYAYTHASVDCAM